MPRKCNYAQSCPDAKDRRAAENININGRAEGTPMAPFHWPSPWRRHDILSCQLRAGDYCADRCTGSEGARELENSRQCNFLFETQKIIEDMQEYTTHNTMHSPEKLHSN
jgi:hypothetical protein